MRTRASLIGLGLALMAMSAAAQTTVTSSGTTATTGNVPYVSAATSTSTTVSPSPISVSGGNVGIGTTAPRGILDVSVAKANGAKQSAYVGGSSWDLTFSGSEDDNGSASLWHNAYTNYNATGLATTNWISSHASFGSRGILFDYGSGITFFADNAATTANTAFTPTSRMVIQNNGNVGIGTTSPNSLFNVFGSDNTGWNSLATFQTANNAAGTNFTQLQVGQNSISNVFLDVNNQVNAKGNLLLLPWGGNVGIGTSPQYSLDVSGQIHSSTGIVFPDGSTQTTAFSPAICGGDYAESVDVMGSRTSYEPGDVLVIDPSAPGKFLKANQAYSTLVAGIYSTKPGTVGRRQTTAKSPDEIPMAVVGIVPIKVSAENGPIHAGDLLVASSTLGRAMKGTDRSKMLGAVVGKALGNLDSGTGVIEVLVTLQ